MWPWVKAWLLLAVISSLRHQHPMRGLPSYAVSAGQTVPDAHTYRDGWVIRNIQQARGDEDLKIEMSPSGTQQAAVLLLEVGQDILAARMFAASARLSTSSGSISAYFRNGEWIVAKGTNRPYSHPTASANGFTNFFEASGSTADAVKLYTAYHDSVTSAVQLPSSARFIIYRPSFHGEGWGNRVMALTAVVALAMGTGRVVLIDWTAAWQLDSYVVFPWALWDWRSFTARHPSVLSLPQTFISAPEQLAAPSSPLSPAFPSPVLVYSSYSSFWGAISRHAAYASLLLACTAGFCASQRTSAAQIHGDALAFLLLGCVSHHVLRPSPPISAAIARDWAPRLAASSRVTAHVRLGPKHTSNYQVTNRRGLETIVRCLRAAMPPGADAKLFLATDSPEVRGMAEDALGAQRVVFQEGPVAHTGEQHALQGERGAAHRGGRGAQVSGVRVRAPGRLLLGAREEIQVQGHGKENGDREGVTGRGGGAGAPAVDERGAARGEAAVWSAMLDWWLLGEGAGESVLSDHSSFGYSAVARQRFNSSLPVTVANDVAACQRRVCVVLLLKRSGAYALC